MKRSVKRYNSPNITHFNCPEIAAAKIMGANARIDLVDVFYKYLFLSEQSLSIGAMLRALSYEAI
jgi:hypothetical protein